MKTISGVAMMALKWFAGEAGVWGDMLDRAPERSIVFELLDAGLIRQRRAWFELSRKGEDLLAFKPVEIKDASFVQGVARATVRTMFWIQRDGTEKVWTETKIGVWSAKFGHTITYPYSDANATNPIASEHETRERMTFCVRLSDMRARAA